MKSLDKGMEHAQIPTLTGKISKNTKIGRLRELSKVLQTHQLHLEAWEVNDYPKET